MTLDELKNAVVVAERLMDERAFTVAVTFERNDRVLDVAITERLIGKCRKGRVWKSKGFLTALKNAEYGFDEHHASSPGGRDGIFILTRDYRPENNMMRKIFDRFLDRSESGAGDIASALGVNVEDLVPVRLVSHHMRLMGVLAGREDHRTLVLVDYDNSK